MWSVVSNCDLWLKCIKKHGGCDWESPEAVAWDEIWEQKLVSSWLFIYLFNGILFGISFNEYLRMHRREKKGCGNDRGQIESTNKFKLGCSLQKESWYPRERNYREELMKERKGNHVVSNASGWAFPFDKLMLFIHFSDNAIFQMWLYHFSGEKSVELFHSLEIVSFCLLYDIFLLSLMYFPHSVVT